MIHTLLVKGSISEATEEAKKRGVKAELLHSTGRETYLTSEATQDQLNEWFCDCPLDPPFPAGTLLFYNSKEALRRVSQSSET